MIVLRTGISTSIGDWKPWEYCPIGTFVIGFNIKVDLTQLDLTSINTIKLICNDDLKSSIYSYDGIWGTWGNYVFCANNKRITGFKYKYSDYLGSTLLYDDTGGNSIYFNCEDNSQIKPSIEGSFGSWTTLFKCSNNSILCGIRIQYLSDQGIFDDIGLNDVEFKCCYS